MIMCNKEERILIADKFISKKVIATAIQNNHTIALYIPNPTPLLQTLMAEANPKSIRCIENPCFGAIKTAINKIIKLQKKEKYTDKVLEALKDGDYADILFKYIDLDNLNDNIKIKLILSGKKEYVECKSITIDENNYSTIIRILEILSSINNKNIILNNAKLLKYTNIDNETIDKILSYDINAIKYIDCSLLSEETMLHLVEKDARFLLDILGL